MKARSRPVNKSGLVNGSKLVLSLSAGHTYGFGDSQGEGRRFDGHPPVPDPLGMGTGKAHGTGGTGG